MKINKKTIIILIIIAAVITGALVTALKYKNMKKEGTESAEQESVNKYPVKTAETIKGDMHDFIKINGSVIAENSVDVYPDTGGKLISLSADIGDYVKKDEIIAEVDPSKPGLSYAPSPVRSPIAGTVTSLPAAAGSTVSVSTPVASVGNLSSLQVEAEIPEPEISKIKMGSESIISFIAYPDLSYSARVVEISPLVNPLTRTMNIKLEFTAEHEEVKAGMFGSIKLFTESKTGVVKIPSSSVIVRDGINIVFILNNDMTVRKAAVDAGITVDGIMEIKGGVEPGDIVVTNGQRLLEDGVSVKVVSSTEGDDITGEDS